MKFTVKQARTYRGKTQIEMAQLLGVHHETYRKMEREPEKISVKMAAKFCRLLGFNVEDIFFVK